MGGPPSFRIFGSEVALAPIFEEGKPHQSAYFACPEWALLTCSQAPFWSLCHDYYHKFDEFRADYSDAVGREPFVEASPRYRWYACPLTCLCSFNPGMQLTLYRRKIGESVTNDDYEEYLGRLDTFSAWFDKTVMPLRSGSDDIMIFPAGITGQKYRDEPPR